MKHIRHKAAKGFTLIELMMAIVIVGILAAVAYPSYQNHVRASRRADAQSDLLQLAGFMERSFTVNNRYDRDASLNPITLPFNTSPQNSSNVAYDISLTTPTSTSFTLKATPKNPGPQAGDGFLELDHTGGRRWDTNNNSIIDPGEYDWER